MEPDGPRGPERDRQQRMSNRVMHKGPAAMFSLGVRHAPWVAPHWKPPVSRRMLCMIRASPVMFQRPGR
jgi:hypothetical protein